MHLSDTVFVCLFVSLIIDVKYDSTPVAASMCLLVRFKIVQKLGYKFVVHCAPQKSEFQVRKSEEPRQPKFAVQLPPQHGVTAVCSPVLSSVICQVVPSLPAHAVFGFSLTTYPVLRHHHQLLANNANDSNVHVSFPASSVFCLPPLAADFGVPWYLMHDFLFTSKN